MIYECKLAPGWDKEIEQHGGIIVEWKYGQMLAYPIMPYGMFSVPSSDVIQQEGVNISAYVTRIEDKNRLHYIGFRVYNEAGDVLTNYGQRQVWYSPDWMIVQEHLSDGSQVFAINHRPGKFSFKVTIQNNNTTFLIDDSNNKVKIESTGNKLTLSRSATPTPSEIVLDNSGVQIDSDYVLLKGYYDRMRLFLQSDLVTVLTALAGYTTDPTSANAAVGTFTTSLNVAFPPVQTAPDQYYTKK